MHQVYMEEIVSSRRKLFRFQIDQYDYECITAKVGFKKSHSIKTCTFHLGMILLDYMTRGQWDTISKEYQ
jgi:hypothetical protein